MQRRSPHRAAGPLALAALLWVTAVAAPAVAEAQQAYSIRGTVVDATTQRPLASVSVVLRGTGLQTLTNVDGSYLLEARVPPGEYELQFALIGRRGAAEPVTLGQATTVQVEPVALEQSVVELEGIVVTGTGAPTERRQIGNTVESVAGEQINRAPGASTVDQALQGKVTGARITQNNGQPGGGVSIRLRGTSSILGGADPLIVVDGVIIDNNSEALVSLSANAGRGGAGLSNRLADISPQDIERIEVIKGAAAAALYGSRANNGVIQIFTKRGSQNAPSVRLSTTLEVNRTPDTYDLNMSPFAGRGDVVFGPATEVGQAIERFDFQDDVFRTGLGTDNQVSIAGGSAGTSYYLSAGLLDEQGILVGSDYRKSSFTGKITQQLADWLEVTARGSFIDSESEFVPEGEQTFGTLTGIIFTPTSVDFGFDPTIGRFPYAPVLAFNPLDVIENWDAPESVTRFFGSVETTFRPSDDLTVRYLVGLDDYRQENTFFRPPFSQSPTDRGLITSPLRQARQFNHDLTANWDLRIGPSLVLTTTPGVRYSENSSRTTRAAAEGLLPGVTIIDGATQFASQSAQELRIFGGWIQERLAIADRVFLTGGVNVEGASAFGQDQRWQVFPRFGASWVLHEEPFWREGGAGDVFSSLRLRAAYGETGGQPPGAFLGETFYPGIAYASRPGFVQSTVLGNPDLEPERQREIEGGFEAGVLDDRAVVELTYYQQKTDNLVLGVPLRPSVGAQQQFQNVGEVTNRGLEVALNTVNLDRPALGWRSRLQFSANRNEVESLVTDADTLVVGYLNAVAVGEPIGFFYGRGCVVENGEEVIDPGTGFCRLDPNRRRIGDPNPDFEAALSNTFQIGQRLTFDVLLDGTFGNDVANFSRRITEFFGVDAAVEEEIRRQMEGESPRQYTLNGARINNYAEYVEDGGYVKLREVSLRYDVAETYTRWLGAGDVTLRVAGRNLYTWTDYSGLDPEINMFTANTVARGVDFATTPLPRSFVFGVDISF